MAEFMCLEEMQQDQAKFMIRLKEEKMRTYISGIIIQEKAYIRLYNNILEKWPINKDKSAFIKEYQLLESERVMKYMKPPICAIGFWNYDDNLGKKIVSLHKFVMDNF